MKEFFVSKELSDKEKKNFAILDTIRKKGPIGRTDISKITGFNIVTVSNYIDHYLKNGVVSEEGYDTSSGGRKPMMVDLQKDVAFAIGLGFDVAHLVGIITDLKCGVLHEIRKDRTEATGKTLVKDISNLLEELVKNPAVDKAKIKGIGVGIAGIIDTESRTIKWPGRPLGSEDTIVSVRLWEELSNKFGIPLIIENDANCAVFGEQWLTLDPEYKDVIYMFSGVACGIMIGGQVFRGAAGCAGELGIADLTSIGEYDWQSESLGLGRWDMELGAFNDIEQMKKTHQDSILFKQPKGKNGKISFDSLIKAAEKQDKLALTLMAIAGKNLGKKIAFLVNLLNPQAVIIGGGTERAGGALLNPLKKTVRDWSFEEATRALKIIPAQLSSNAVPLGAASLVIKNYFEQM